MSITGCEPGPRSIQNHSRFTEGYYTACTCHFVGLEKVIEMVKPAHKPALLLLGVAIVELGAADEIAILA